MKKFYETMNEISKHYYDNEDLEFDLLLNLYSQLWTAEHYSDKKILIFAMQDAIRYIYAQTILDEIEGL